MWRCCTLYIILILYGPTITTVNAKKLYNSFSSLKSSKTQLPVIYVNEVSCGFYQFSIFTRTISANLCTKFTPRSRCLLQFPVINAEKNQLMNKWMILHMQESTITVNNSTIIFTEYPSTAVSALPSCAYSTQELNCTISQRYLILSKTSM